GAALPGASRRLDRRAGGSADGPSRTRMSDADRAEEPRPPPEARSRPADATAEMDQPGAGHLRAAVEYAQRQLGRCGRVRDDALAGLNTAIANVPDGMASGLLAGVNPVYGLYACIAGPIAG